MKKAYIHIIPCALAIMALTGCGNDGSEPDISGKSICPEFSATIGSQSRAYDDKWNEGDSIGISGSGSSNVCYVTNNGDGNFEVASESEPIYFHNDDEVSFSAYYPWNESVGEAKTIDIDTDNQSVQKTFDFLWATAKGEKSKPNVTFNFDHKMVKLRLKVIPGNGTTLDDVKEATLSLGGIKHSGSFSIEDGTATAIGDPSETCNFPEPLDEGRDTVFFSFILIPQEFNNPVIFSASFQDSGVTLEAAIDFTSANIVKDGEDAKNEWVAGRQYNLSLTLNTEVEVTVNDASITDWNSIVHEEPIDAR